MHKDVRTWVGKLYMEIILEIFNKQTQDQVFGNILKFLFENIFKADFLRDLCFTAPLPTLGHIMLFSC